MNPVTLIANRLHPVYQGRQLSQNQVSEAYDLLIDQLESDGLEQLAAFRNRAGVFTKLF